MELICLALIVLMMAFGLIGISCRSQRVPSGRLDPPLDPVIKPVSGMRVPATARRSQPELTQPAPTKSEPPAQSWEDWNRNQKKPRANTIDSMRDSLLLTDKDYRRMRARPGPSLSDKDWDRWEEIEDTMRASGLEDKINRKLTGGMPFGLDQLWSPDVSNGDPPPWSKDDFDLNERPFGEIDWG